MRILFFLILSSILIIGLIYELDHGLAKGRITIPEFLNFKETPAPKAA